MFELAGLAAAAVAAVVPLLAKAAGKGVLAESAAGSLYGLMKKKLGTPAAQEALADLAAAPDSGDAQTVLRVQIDKALQRGAELAQALHELVERHQQQTGQIAQVRGDGNRVIQVSGSGNTIVR